MASTTSLPSVATRTVSQPAPDGMGSGLFATTDIEPGQDVLHVKTPFVAVLDSPILEDHCACCFTPEQKIRGRLVKRCTGCRAVKYCDKVLPNNIRALLRIVLRVEHKYDAKELKIFEDLQTHVPELEASGHLNRIKQTARAVKNYSGTKLDEGTIVNYAAMLDANCLRLQSAFYDRIGLYLHPYASLINHSCDYNSVVGFDRQELYVRAKRPIKKGQQIFISYIDATTPRYVRRRELKERYFFDCHCLKCVWGHDTLEDRFLSPPRDKATIVAANREALELRRIALAPDTKPADRIQKTEAAMRRLRATGVWPLTRQPYPSWRDDLIVHSPDAGRLPLALIHAAIRSLRIDPLMYDKSDPIRLSNLWTLGETIIIFAARQESVRSNPKDPVRVHDFDLNFSCLLFKILAQIMAAESESPTVPTFRSVIEHHLATLNTQYKAKGRDLYENKPFVAFEWRRLEALVDKALEKE
ncbi:Zinc finger MYND-type [Penicillium sp. DV-2018c]|nr:Zinc finger MYND-type [Penicillium sp. DV-2018c]